MSNDKNRSGSWPRTAALAVTAGVVLLTSGCGGGSTPSGSSSPGESSTVKADIAFEQCMRSHGVPGVNVNGHSISDDSHSPSGGSQAQFQSAMTACSHLLPGGQPSQAQQAQAFKQALKYVDCMRSHGVPNMPDPNSNGDVSASSSNKSSSSSDLNPNSPVYQKAQQACQSLMPGGGPS